MSQLKFFKYHGTGNDFIMIDNLKGEIDLTHDRVVKWCDRHFGIGSDGLIAIEASSEEGVDFVMNFFNPDYSKSFCGNGSRCAIAFARTLGFTYDVVKFKAIDGLHEGKYFETRIEVKMKDVDGIIRKADDAVFLHTGSPHYIVFSREVDQLNVMEEGRKIRYNAEYKAQGTNVNFVEEVKPGTIFMRTYERGVEDETLSCGTGVTAAALAYAAAYPNFNRVIVHTRGGELLVKLNQSTPGVFDQVWLCGPAAAVYEGSIRL